MPPAERGVHVYRWDLDQTYLETDIHSVRGLLRAAVEPAARKRNVPGSGVLIRGLTRTDPATRVVVVSGSPEQMRPVLEQKLALDGVVFDRLVLKDNLGNLRRGRLSAVRGQVGYKLPHLFELRVDLAGAVKETLFGDDTEADAAIYALYADAIAGRVGPDEVRAVLRASRAYDDVVERAVAALARIERADAVEDVFIRVHRRIPLSHFRLLGPRVTPVFSWFQAAVLLFDRGRLDAEGLGAVALACSGEAADHAAWLVDLVRRDRLGADVARAAVEACAPLVDARGALARALDRMGRTSPNIAPGAPDYLGFLRAVGAR